MPAASAEHGSIGTMEDVASCIVTVFILLVVLVIG